MQNETIGNRIKQKRRMLKLTQKDVARFAGLSASAVTEWELDMTQPSGESLVHLSKVLECSAEWIMTGKGDNELDKDPEIKGTILNKEHIELITLYDSLPRDEAKRFLREMKVKKAHYDAIFEEMLQIKGLSNLKNKD